MCPKSQSSYCFGLIGDKEVAMSHARFKPCWKEGSQPNIKIERTNENKAKEVDCLLAKVL